MKFFKMCVVAILLVSMADAMPINSSARSCIPADTLQLISVDYRAIKDSPTAMALKTQLMPDNIKQFEAALKGIGIDPDKDVDTLTFASFRSGKQGVKGVGVAAGPFNMKAVLKKMKLEKFVPKKYGTADVYPMDGGFIMSFLDDSTLLFGDSTGVHAALDTRDGKTLSLDTNGNLADMMSNVDSAAVWSILDQQGTQNMIQSAIGEAAKITDFEKLKKNLVGSRYTAESMWEVVGLPGLAEKTRLLPPGVDVHVFRPRAPEEAKARLGALAERLEDDPAGWGGSADAAEALRAADPTRDRVVSYVGKLIVSKGVDLLVAAWPLVVDSVPDARLMIAGFGEYSNALVLLASAIGEGDLDTARVIARRGRELEGGRPGELRYLASFLDTLDGDELERYLKAAPVAMSRVHFTGRIEHSDVSELMSASEALVVPSTFPEAFGMVLAEAACCGSVPVSAAHSGLAEVTAVLEPAVGENLRPQLSFELGSDVVRQIAGNLAWWLTFASDTPDAWAQAMAALGDVARAGFGWPDVASGVAAAAQGRLGDLPPVPAR